MAATRPDGRCAKLELAQFTQARFHAVYVVHPWCMARYAGYFDPDQLRNVLREDGRMALEEARWAMAERGLPGDTEIDETEDAADDIPHCLARCVQRQGAGLVADGHTRPAWHRAIVAG
jgi:hypothetical protein